MSEPLVDIIRAWKRNRGDESLWVYITRRNPWLFSHHPAEECFREHVWFFRGLYFCKGCAVTVIGWIAAIVVQLGFDWLRYFSIEQVALIFSLLLLPSVLTSLLGAPRLYKHVARFLLGVLVISAIWMLFVTDQWWVRGVVVTAYFLVKIPLDKYRTKQNKKCVDAHKAQRPTCGRRGIGTRV